MSKDSDPPTNEHEADEALARREAHDAHTLLPEAVALRLPPLYRKAREKRPSPR